MKTILLALFTLFISACDGEAQSQKNADPTRNLSIIARDAKRHDFNIELALTPQQQMQGLMNRTEMAKNAGMLFYFAKEEERGFWMKNTLIPLDILYIKNDGTILRIHENAIPHDLTSLPSRGPARAALELNGGTTARLGIKEGDVVHHVFFGNALE